MNRPAGGQRGEPMSALPSTLDDLASLIASERFREAIEALRSSQALRSSLSPQDCSALEALLMACDICDEETRSHHAALGRAIEREQALGSHLRWCTDQLMTSQRRG